MTPLKTLSSKSSLSSDELAQLLRQREADPTEGQSLSSIYDFIDNVGNNAYAINPVHEDGQESGWGTTAGWAFKKPTDSSSNEGGARADPFTFDPGPLFSAGVTLSPQAGTEGSGGYHFNVDASKFPLTSLGKPVTETARVNDRQRLYNPGAVVDDPNYGHITDYRNVRPDQLNTIMQLAIPSLAMAGVGSLMAPVALSSLGLGSGTLNPGSLISLARTLSNGGDPTSAGLGIIGDALGLPSWLKPVESLVLGQLNRGGHG